jgi:hypothetical protein
LYGVFFLFFSWCVLVWNWLQFQLSKIPGNLSDLLFLFKVAGSYVFLELEKQQLWHGTIGFLDIWFPPYINIMVDYCLIPHAYTFSNQKSNYCDSEYFNFHSNSTLIYFLDDYKYSLTLIKHKIQWKVVFHVEMFPY